MGVCQKKFFYRQEIVWHWLCQCLPFEVCSCQHRTSFSSRGNHARRSSDVGWHWNICLWYSAYELRIEDT
ncbi:MAG: hypothetical protein ACTHK7_06730, partial [Aureliella sp.]